jgi:translation initiation factor IF-3
VVIKEIRFGPNTEEHDFNFKVKHSSGFLQEGSKVKATVTFFGRSIVYKERGEILLLRFAQALEEFGKVESMPRLEGKRMSMLLMPKVGKK